jgi:hypothetical protein
MFRQEFNDACHQLQYPIQRDAAPDRGLRDGYRCAAGIVSHVITRAGG